MALKYAKTIIEKILSHRSILRICIVLAILFSASIFWREDTARILWVVLRLETIPLTLNPNNPDLVFSMGDSHFGGNGTYDVEKAQMYFIRAISLRQDFAEAHYQLGRVRFIKGEFLSALAEMREVIRIEPEYKRAYYMYGLISGYRGDLDEAAWGFEEFIKRDDFNWAGYNDLAWVYFKKGDYQKTRDIAARGIERAYRNPWLYLTYGTALLNLGEKTPALEALHIALEESEKMTPENWGHAYPGNDPKIYAQGLEEMRQTIRRNIELTESLP